MKTMKTIHARRKRRTARQTLKHGPLAKRKHVRIAGRSGVIRSKQRAGLRKALA